MQFEVEQKFAVANHAEIEQRLTAMGADILPPIEQVDAYYAHPSRDFAETDEALRVRRTREAVRITYKGPRIDSTTKTRREIEIPLADGPAASQIGELFQCLGFRLVAEVHKRRRAAHLVWQGQEVEVVLDEVRDVGPYVELEIAAEEAGLDAAREALASLAAALHLSSNERRSYLELLLERR
ncbi:MAG: class IV adenylate cyclase [Pirellulaceae bacterium]